MQVDPLSATDRVTNRKYGEGLGALPDVHGIVPDNREES